MTRFVRQVRCLTDTPSLIRLIATDAGYLMVCHAIVNDPLHRKQEIVRSIKTVCWIQGFDFHLLQQKLTPVAGALGLTLSSNFQIDYYHLLGISLEAGSQEIKKAFRKKAYEFHPDTSKKGHDDHEKFFRLKTYVNSIVVGNGVYSTEGLSGCQQNFLHFFYVSLANARTINFSIC